MPQEGVIFVKFKLFPKCFFLVCMINLGHLTRVFSIKTFLFQFLCDIEASQFLNSQKIVKKLIFFSKSYFLNLNLNSTCCLLCFDMHIIYFPQNFEILIFFARRFSLTCNISPSALVAKLVFKGCCFGYLWTAKDQNL